MKTREIPLSEYVELLEDKLLKLKTEANYSYITSKDSNLIELQLQIKELQSHIEDLKMELDEPINIDGMTDWRETQN